ncbi:MAG TPA: ABC transporter permease subunit [Tetrasphaera sp.]|uniref:ABC transporter permease subunit n=1 Tax=Nostocoides sp. TaxID=1917966 RepID=UPI002B9BA1A9|nr:ABC transporter permease subunit [Tetrasphaera sp.]HNQ06781.1 ABC transporter permease subunit [Tetrasphaera sp.]
MAVVPSTNEFRVRKDTTPLYAHILKWGLLALATLAALYVVQKLIAQGSWFGVVITAFILTCILAVYATRRAVPMKYLLPGLILLVTLQIWPIVYTVATAFTNYGQGHVLSKDEATTQSIAQSVQQVAGSPRYKLSIAVPEGADPMTGDLNFLLIDPDGKYLVGNKDGVKDLATDGVAIGDKPPMTGLIATAPGYTILTPKQVNDRNKTNADEVTNFAVPVSKEAGIKALGTKQAFQGEPTLVYDAKADTLTDAKAGKVYVPKNAYWTAEDGSGTLPTGWKQNVGFKNFKDLLTNETIRAGFFKIFIWNVAFAAISVLSTFFLGMLLALLFNDDKLKGKGFYRSLLILPYAIPGFVTSLVWASMFNQDFGLINSLTHLHIDWLGNAWWAKVAILLTNLWLGFPYMFLVCTGALQSIPGDVREAAKIDGASPFRTLRSIIMPLLLVAVGPLLIASFAFNFNNFTLIYLLTKGGPFEAADTSIGSTDLLITYAFRLAFSGASPNIGLASAVCIFIFFIVAAMSYSGFARTKSLEEVN